MSGLMPKPSKVFGLIKLFGNYFSGMIYRIALFGGKRVSDKRYYVNGFFESP
jgi:hypothetical protein